MVMRGKAENPRSPAGKRWELSRGGMAIALAASIGFHSAAAWGAGLWMTSALHTNHFQVITIRFLGNEPTPNAGRSSEPPRHKRAEEFLRFSPPSAPRLATLQKTLIAQKPLVSRLPAGPPKPDFHRAAVKVRLSPSEPDPSLVASNKGALPLERPPSAEAQKPDGANEGSSTSLFIRNLTVAALDNSGQSERALRLDAIRRRIQEALVYPTAARRFGWEGSAWVRIVLAPDGALSALTLESSSQIAVLDREVLAAVKRAAPYPYVEGPIVVPVVFDLRAP